MPRGTLDRQSLIRALLIFVLLMGVSLPVVILQSHYAQQLRQTRLEFTAAQVSKRLELQLTNRIEMLKVLGHFLSQADIADLDRFRGRAQTIMDEVLGFYAINWIKNDGVITWVVPYDANSPALDKNLLQEPAVAPYLNASVTERAAKMSHIVKLFQGPEGFVVYLPIFVDGAKPQLAGWINGVFAAKEFFDDLLVAKAFEDYYLRVSFAGHGETVFENTPPAGSQNWGIGRAELPIFGQRIEIEISPRLQDSAYRRVRRLEAAMIGGLLLAVLTLAYIWYQLMASRSHLRDRLERERLQGILLNLLVHDILNPLLIVRYNVEAAMRLAGDEVMPQLKKTLYGVEQLQDVITRVRDLRAIELGKKPLSLSPIPVNDLITSTQRLFEASMREKRLTFAAELCPTNPEVMVDRSLFQNNVLNNVMSNAIKFSEPGQVIQMRAEVVSPGMVSLDIVDHGMGMSENTLRSVLMEGAQEVSKKGTLGEPGTGIGMLQVMSYMRFFAGSVKIRSVQKGSASTDHGTRVSLLLRVDDDEPVAKDLAAR